MTEPAATEIGVDQVGPVSPQEALVSALGAYNQRLGAHRQAFKARIQAEEAYITARDACSAAEALYRTAYLQAYPPTHPATPSAHD